MDTPAYDLIVIGAGPAGLTAATEAARAGLKVYCFDKLAPGSYEAWSPTEKLGTLEVKKGETAKLDASSKK